MSIESILLRLRESRKRQDESLLKTSQLAPGYKIKGEEDTPVEIVSIKKLSDHEYDITVKLPDGSTDKWYDYEDKPQWERVKESDEENYISVEYTYNGDDTSDYLGHVKVRTDFKVTALQAAEKYAMNKHPEADPRHFVISKDKYTNVDVIDKDGHLLTDLSEDADEDQAYADIEKDREYRIENQCEQCGSQLTDSGECPKCDLGEEDIGESPEYHSSFEKETMRKVNADAPSALHWRDGDIIYNTKTEESAVFLGYKKNAIGILQAIFDDGVSRFPYSLSDMQEDIEAGILVNKSRK